MRRILSWICWSFSMIDLLIEVKFLLKNKVETKVDYKTPLHLSPVYSDLGYNKGDFPVSEHISHEILSLPISQFLSIDEIMYVVSILKKFDKINLLFRNQSAEI